MAAVVAEGKPQYARRNKEGFYTWDGAEYPSVTTILGEAPGQHLMMWYSKQAALRAASLLIAAGIEPPERDAVLEEFCRAKDERISKTDAVRRLFEWQHVMREAERYRDHKARIGSVVHHWIYQRVLGMPYVEGELDGTLYHIAVSLGPDIWRVKSDPDFLPSDEMLAELATMAKPYVLSAHDWMELDKPEFEEIGQEAVIVSPTHGYAGTKDARAVLRTVNGEPLPEPRVYDIDFKTSNSLSKAVRMQVEAYRNADFIGLVATGETYPIDDAHGIGALHIGPHAGHAELQDEFGTLSTKAKQLGAKLYTADGNQTVFEGFLGLLKYHRVINDLPAWDQTQKREKAEPKKTIKEVRDCPF